MITSDRRQFTPQLRHLSRTWTAKSIWRKDTVGADVHMNLKTCTSLQGEVFSLVEYCLAYCLRLRFSMGKMQKSSTAFLDRVQLISKKERTSSREKPSLRFLFKMDVGVSVTWPRDTAHQPLPIRMLQGAAMWGCFQAAGPTKGGWSMN